MAARQLRPIALTIAGSDSGGGAGIQADLKTFHQFGVYGTSAITLITVQNTVGVSRVEVLDAQLVRTQIDAVRDDLPPQAVKTGALGNAAIIVAIGEREWDCPLIVDPVMVSSSGAVLMESGAREALRGLLLPRAALVTPNLHEAMILSGLEVQTVAQMRLAAVRIAECGASAVLIKGGHLESGETVVDVLYYQGEFTELVMPRIATAHTHGTGCTYSAAITALMAQGAGVVEAVRRAREFLQEAIRTAPGLGRGAGPLNHWGGSV